MSLLIFLVKIKEGHNLKVLRREKNGHDHENFEISPESKYFWGKNVMKGMIFFLNPNLTSATNERKYIFSN